MDTEYQEKKISQGKIDLDVDPRIVGGIGCKFFEDLYNIFEWKVYRGGERLMGLQGQKRKCTNRVFLCFMYFAYVYALHCLLRRPSIISLVHICSPQNPLAKRHWLAPQFILNNYFTVNGINPPDHKHFPCSVKVTYILDIVYKMYFIAYYCHLFICT